VDNPLAGAADKFVTVNGLKLHYLEWGGANRETVVLLHGFANCAATWYRLAGLLAEKRRVIAPDFRGHGDSDWSAAFDYTLDDHASDVAGLVAQLEIERLSMVGHSMGSAVAQRYAAKYPGRVARLVLVDNGPRFGTAALNNVSARPAAPERMDSFEVAADYLALGDPFAPREVLLKEAEFLTRRDADGSLIWKRHQASGLPRLTPAEIEARWQILRSINCPTLIVRGDQSLVFEAAVAAEMSRVMASASLIEIPGAGHYVHRDNPAAFDGVVLEFLG
jgi:esterase